VGYGRADPEATEGDSVIRPVGEQQMSDDIIGITMKRSVARDLLQNASLGGAAISAHAFQNPETRERAIKIVLLQAEKAGKALHDATLKDMAAQLKRDAELFELLKKLLVLTAEPDAT
jgi:hypothetical protein